MSTHNLAQRFAQYAVNLRYEDLPAAVVHEVKRRVLDTLGCAMGALGSEPAAIARALAATATSTEPATVIGTSLQTTPETAAFANGVLFRYLDFNDTYLSLEPAHPSDNLAAVFAAAESQCAGGREVITATVLAYEIQCRLCDAASLRMRGWDHVTYGAYSTSVAAGKLLGLDAGQMAHALALAGVPNNAMRQTRVGMLSHWKGCAFANASRNGVFAARLAQLGMTGADEVFEGQMGFFNQVSGPFEIDKLGGYFPEGVSASERSLLGADGRSATPYKILDTYIKKYPAEYHAQSAIDAAIELRELIGPVEDIEAVTIESCDAAVEIIGCEPEKWEPTTRETADHSLPYCVAAALVDGDITLNSFDDAHLADERIKHVLKRTEVISNEALDALYPAGIPNSVRIRTIDTVAEKEVTFPRGHSSNPLTDAEVEAKFRMLARPVLPEGRIDEIVARCWALENEESISSFLWLFTV